MKDKKEKTCQCDPHEISYKCCACHFKEPQVMNTEEKKVFKKVFGAIEASKEEVILQRIEQALTQQREDMIEMVEGLKVKIPPYKKDNHISRDYLIIRSAHNETIIDIINKLKKYE